MNSQNTLRIVKKIYITYSNLKIMNDIRICKKYYKIKGEIN